MSEVVVGKVVASAAAVSGSVAGWSGEPGRMRRVRRWWEARLAGRANDGGSALVEFLGISLVLLVPVVYLVLVLGRIQAATFAVEGAAREAARVYVAADDPEQGTARALTAVAVALADQGFDDDPAAALRVRCSVDPCLTPGAEVAASVEVRVALPFVPSFVGDVVPLEVPVGAERVAPVDAYRVAR